MLVLVTSKEKQSSLIIRARLGSHWNLWFCSTCFSSSSHDDSLLLCNFFPPFFLLLWFVDIAQYSCTWTWPSPIIRNPTKSSNLQPWDTKKPVKNTIYSVFSHMWLAAFTESSLFLFMSTSFVLPLGQMNSICVSLKAWSSPLFIVWQGGD